MRTMSLTEAKKDLSHLAQQEQSFKLTNRGQEIATFRVFMQPKFDPDKARAAFDQFKATRHAKTNARNGATQAVRALRDGT